MNAAIPTSVHLVLRAGRVHVATTLGELLAHVAIRGQIVDKRHVLRHGTRRRAHLVLHPTEVARVLGRYHNVHDSLVAILNSIGT